MNGFEPGSCFEADPLPRESSSAPHPRIIDASYRQQLIAKAIAFGWIDGIPGGDGPPADMPIQGQPAADPVLEEAD